MTGSKTTTMTLEEMRGARERGENKSELDRVHRMVRNGIEPAEDADAPNAADLMRAEINKRRHGRPVGSVRKVQVSIRYHQEVVDYFKSTGEGWQTRMDEALMEWIKAHPHPASRHL